MNKNIRLTLYAVATTLLLGGCSKEPESSGSSGLDTRVDEISSTIESAMSDSEALMSRARQIEAEYNKCLESNPDSACEDIRNEMANLMEDALGTEQLEQLGAELESLNRELESSIEALDKELEAATRSLGGKEQE